MCTLDAGFLINSILTRVSSIGVVIGGTVVAVALSPWSLREAEGPHSRH